MKHKGIKCVRNGRNEEYGVDISYDYWICLQAYRKYRSRTLLGEYAEVVFVFYHR